MKKIALLLLLLSASSALEACTDAYARPRRTLRRGTATMATPSAPQIDAGAMDALPTDLMPIGESNGQSNNLGIDNDGGSSMTDTGLRASDSGISRLTEVATAGNETPVTAAANYYKDTTGRDSCEGNASVSNTPFSGWGPGTTPYTRSRDQVTLCAGTGAALKSGAVGYLLDIKLGGGENDELNGRTMVQYGTDILSYYTNAQTDYSNKWFGHVPIFQVPHCASTELSTQVPTAETSLGAWYATTLSPRICIAGTSCQLAWIANNPHMTATSACIVGAYYGRARYWYWDLQRGCLGRVIDQTRVTAANNVITACTKGGDGSALVLDTTNVAQKGAYYGFYFTDSQTDTPAITGVAINGTNNQCVDITLTRNVDCASSPQLAYMDYGIISVDPGGANAMSVGGNVRDSDATTYTCGGASQHLYNWLAGFRTSVVSCTGSAQAFTWANTGSLDSNGSATNALSARNPTDLNGLANASWFMRVRSNAATWPTSANVLWQLAQSGQRMFDMRTAATAGSMRFFLSTSLSDSANFTECTGFSGQTWYDVLITKSGTTLHFYRNGVNIDGSCTLTGSVPANNTSPTRATEQILSAQGSSANFNGRDFAKWTRTLDSADALELYCGNRSSCGGSAITNPCVLSTGAPVHGYPLNSTYEDCGSAAAIPLTPFGSGWSFEATHPN